MTDKITLIQLQNQANDSTAVSNINSNSATIQSAFDNTLSRDGTSPNQMGAPLDMNSFPIINLPTPTSNASPLRLQDLASFIGHGTISTLPVGGTSGQLLTKSSNADYAVSWTSISTSLDTLGSIQGSILYRNSTGWVPLTPGTNGQILTSAGASANPSWASAIGVTPLSSLIVGPNGATNPTLNVDTSTTSAATGLLIKSAAAGGGIALSVLSSGTNESISITPKGSGHITIVTPTNGGGATGIGGGLIIGSNASSGDDSAVLVTRSLTPASGLLVAHAFRDETIANEAVTASAFSGYCSYDAIPQVLGTATTAQNHYRSFQARPYLKITGTCNEIAPYWSGPTIDGSSTVVPTLAHFKATQPSIINGATVNTQAAFFSDTLSGAGTNFGVQIGNNPSTFGGTVTAPQFVATQAAAGGLAFLDASAQSFITIVGVGSAALLTGTGYYLVFIAEVGQIAGSALYTMGGVGGGPFGSAPNWDTPTTTPASGHYSIAYDGSVGYRIYSNRTGTSSFKFTAIRIV